MLKSVCGRLKTSPFFYPSRAVISIRNYVESHLRVVV